MPKIEQVNTIRWAKLSDEMDFFPFSVTTISDVVKRYRQVLRIIKRGHTMSRAFLKAGVSRNAVKDTAAIAELSQQMHEC